MEVVIFDSKQELGHRAAQQGAAEIRSALDQRGHANIILATGASQFSILEELTAAPGINWAAVTAFHLDEYVGLPATHPASFRLYLQERFLNKLPVPPHAFYAINGEGDCQEECRRLGALIRECTIDVAFVGVGENGHLAFNDPPADFQTEEPYLVVNLDEACRQQQVGEGWFKSLQDVPQQAISMSIRQIMKSRSIICSVPDSRKREAVKAAVKGPVTPLVPASILQQHDGTMLYLDRESASLL